jgi:hypothetical protein
MSVIAINERFDTGGGTEAAMGRTHTRKFLIECDSTSDNTATIQAGKTVGPDILPSPNSEFPGDPAAKCGIIQYSRLSELVWEATCPYSFQGDTGTIGTTSTRRPWELPPYGISVSSYSITRAIEKGYKAGDAQNVPSDPIVIPVDPPDKFDPPPTDEVYISLLKFSYNLQFFALDWVKSYRNTVNAAPVSVLDLSIPAKCALLRTIGGTRNTVKNETEDYVWWQIDVEMAIDDAGFDLELLLAGFHMMDTAKKYEIGINKSGEIVKRTAASKDIDAVTEPQLLKADGTLVGVGGTPVYKKWQVKYAKNWDSLNLPKSLDVQ